MNTKPCKRGNIAERDQFGHCLCQSCKTFRNRPSERKKKYLKQWQQDNPEKVRVYTKKWISENQDKHNEIINSWRKRNPDKVKEIWRKSGAKWAKNNKGKRNAITRKRVAAKLHRTVSWANLEKIQQIYIEAIRLTEETGIPYEVDHIIPLQGENVSGLHVENNLRIITRSVNRVKKNLCVV